VKQFKYSTIRNREIYLSLVDLITAKIVAVFPKIPNTVSG